MTKEQERSLKMARVICKALDEKKGLEIITLDISEISPLADYFIIASATNDSQLTAMEDEVFEKTREAGFHGKTAEGKVSGGWIVLDYGDVVVHLFKEEQRSFYDIERIWQDAKALNLLED